jgi:hypothetical protein
VFGLAGGLGFAFGEFPDLRPPYVLLGRTGDLERDLCLNLSLSFELRQTEDEEVGWAYLRDRLDAGIATMIWTDMKYLDYLRVKMHNTHHTVVAVGYDPAQGVAYISDNDRDDPQPCSLESLARARNSPAFPYGPNLHGTWMIDFPDELPDAADAIERGLRRAVENMTDDDERMGMNGARAFGASYPRWPETFGDRLGDAMRGIVIFVVKAGTGGAMFRSLQAGFLDGAARLLTAPELADAGRVYHELAEEWRKLAAASDREDALAAHRDALPHVERIVELEQRGTESMQGWLNGR